MLLPYERYIRWLVFTSHGGPLDVLAECEHIRLVRKGQDGIASTLAHEARRDGPAMSVVGAQASTGMAAELAMRPDEYLKAHKLKDWTTKAGKAVVARARALWCLPRAREIAVVQTMHSQKYERIAAEINMRVPEVIPLNVDAETVRCFKSLFFDLTDIPTEEGVTYLKSSDYPRSYLIAWVQGVEAGMFQLGYVDVSLPMVDMYARIATHTFLELDAQRWDKTLKPLEYRITYQTFDDACRRVNELRPDVSGLETDEQIREMQLAEKADFPDMSTMMQENERATDLDLLQSAFRASLVSKEELDRWTQVTLSTSLPLDLSQRLRQQLRGAEVKETA